MVDQALTEGGAPDAAGGSSEGFSEHDMPNGVRVQYHWEPKRKYMLQPVGARDEEWYEVPSVSKMADLLEKGGLSHWGQRIGIAAVQQLLHTGAVRLLQTPSAPNGVICVPRDGQWVVASTEALVDLAKAFKIDIQNTKDTAADRGTSVHKAFELWGSEGLVPDPKIFPENEKGYVEALVKFINDCDGGLQIEHQEVVVASVKHGFAGRFDFRGKVTKEIKVCHRVTALRNEHYSTLQPGIVLGDVKTSKDVFLSQMRQLEGYEIASQEVGYEPADHRLILNFQQDGYYQCIPSFGTANSFLVVLALWRDEQEMKRRKKEHGGARFKG